MAKREPAQRERGTGRVYQQRDPQHHGRRAISEESPT
jgi:hypothetical protein